MAALAFSVMLAWRGQNRSLAQREMNSAAECSSRLTKPSSIRPPSPAASNSGAGVAGVADELAVGVGVGHEVPRRGQRRQRRAAVLGWPGRRPRRRAPTGRRRSSGRPATCAAVAGLDAAHRRRRSARRDLRLLLGCRSQARQRAGVDAVGDQDADLARRRSCPGRWPGCSAPGRQAGRGRARRAAGSGSGSSGRPRPSATARARSSSTLRSPATIRVRIVRPVALAELEHERVDDVLLLDLGLADRRTAAPGCSGRRSSPAAAGAWARPRRPAPSG